MKTRFKLIIPVLAILILFTVSCTKTKITEKAEWKGEIEYENGIKIVKNPAEPVYGEILFDLEEDLSIGREDDDNYMFYRPRKINTDDQGNIYILERGNHRIQKFDLNGQYLQTIGQKGQGPGEFERPYSFFLDKNKNIYVTEGRKIQIFNSEGEFLRSIPVSYFTTNFSVTPDGNIFAVASITKEEARNQAVIKMDQKGKIIKTIAEFPDIKPVSRKGKGGSISVFSVSHSYNPSLYFSQSANGKVIYAYSSEYSLFQFNLEGNIELIIKKEEPYHSISQKEKSKIYEGFSELEERWPKGVVKEAVQFPPHRPFFSRIITDDRGRIYVRRIEPVHEEDETVEFDIFSKDGYYLYKTNLPFTPEIIKNGCFYDLNTSEETGEVKIKRFKIKNWEQIELSDSFQ